MANELEGDEFPSIGKARHIGEEWGSDALLSEEQSPRARISRTVELEKAVELLMQEKKEDKEKFESEKVITNFLI